MAIRDAPPPRSGDRNRKGPCPPPLDSLPPLSRLPMVYERSPSRPPELLSSGFVRLPGRLGESGFRDIRPLVTDAPSLYQGRSAAGPRRDAESRDDAGISAPHRRAGAPLDHRAWPAKARGVVPA